MAFRALLSVFLWHTPLLSHMKPAAMLFTCSPPQSSSTLLVLLVHSLPSPPCLCLSVLPTSSSSPRLLYHMDPPIPSMPTHPPPLQPRAPSPTSPDEFPMNVKQAYKAFAAVPRSLAVLEPPQVGRAARTPPGHNDKSMLC